MTKRKAGSTKPPIVFWTDKEVEILSNRLHLKSEEIFDEGVLPGRTVPSIERKRLDIAGSKIKTPAPSVFNKQHASVFGYAAAVARSV